MDARDTMMDSGLNPYKKSKGYRAVELGTRQHLRILQDATRRLVLADRPVLEDAMNTASTVHDEVFGVLFQ